MEKKKREKLKLEFADVDAKKVVVKNCKLYVNREEGFIGTSIKKR